MATREYEPVICANEMYTQQKKTSKLGPHLYQVHPGLEKGSKKFLHCWQYSNFKQRYLLPQTLGVKECVYINRSEGLWKILEIKIGGVKTHYFREWNQNKPKAHKINDSLDWESEQKTAERKWTKTSTETLNTNTGLPLKHLLWNGWCCPLGTVFLSRHVNVSLFVFTRWDPECCRQALSR